jgi:tRNA(Ile)-lysidine synthase
MTGLHQRVRRTITKHELLPSGSRVLVAVSGGSDSVALAMLLCDLSESLAVGVAGLAHLNHCLRDTAARDEAVCERLADRLGLPFVVERADVAGYATSQRLSVEDAARRVRYEFLERSATRIGAERIAVGHTLDDQAETVLLKLIRGAGPAGLGGIFPKRGRVVRPLLDVDRVTLRGYLTERGVEWTEDETNQDLTNPRNRIRHVVLPELERAYGGSVRASIARAAAVAREDGAWLETLSDRVFGEVAVRVGDGWELDARRLADEPAPIVRRVLLKALRLASGGREIGQEHVTAVAAVLAGACGGTDVPGGRVHLSSGKLVLSEQGGRPR